MVSTVHFLALGAAVASAEYFEGDGTSYTLGDVSSGNCNFMSAIPTASTNYAAINSDQWDDLASCGRCAEVSCIDDQCADQTTTAVVQILDQCPECSSGDLDLSPTVFANITGSDPSRLTVRWRFVDCPNPGNIEVCLKTGSNGYYVAVQPTNTLVGVESVTINGESTTMVDSAYYYLIESTSEVDLTAVSVSITSIEGETVEGTYSLTTGACVDTNQQFTTSSSSQTTTSTTTTAPVSTMATPTSTTATPTSTTATPTSTTMIAPVSTTATPGSTTATPTTTTAPVSTTATPTSTTATPTSTTTSAPVSTSAAQTQGSSVAEEADSSYTEETTLAPISTTAAPETTTASTETPSSTTATPRSTTSAPVSTTATPDATTATPTTASTSSPKCRVRRRRD